MIIHIDGIDREATKDEIAVCKAEQTELAESIAKIEADRAKAKADVLAKLGLTAYEVAALLA